MISDNDREIKSVTNLNDNLSDSPDRVVYSQCEEIDLRKVLLVVWRGKWHIFFVTFCFAALSVLYALSIPDEYESTAILAPASSSSASSLSKIAGQFGGLASLAGVNLGASDSVDNTSIAMKMIKTWGFIETFIEENNLAVEVFAAVGWDKDSGQLLIDEEIYDLKEKKWKVVIDEGKTKSLEPSSWDLYKRIKGRITISQDSKTGLIALSVMHYSPYIAKSWVDLLIVEMNNYMKLKDRNEALNSIKYLKGQIEITDVAEMRSIFYQLIEEQTKTLMLAEISDEYVFKTISSAKVAEEKSGPKRALIVILITMLGFILSILTVVFICLVIKKEKID